MTREKKMKRIAVIGAAALLAVCAYALEINDVYEVSVASGSQEISEAITGSGSIRKTGAGTLVLSGANTFTGGVSVEAGRVEVAATGALGSGPVAITSTGASGSGNVRFTVAGTFANTISVTGTGGSKDYPQLVFTKAVTLTGAITSGCNLFFYGDVDSCPDVTIDASVTAAGCVVGGSVRAHYKWIRFKKPVVCDKLAERWGWPGGLGGARLDSTANAFNRIEIGYTTLYCGAAGVLPENAVVQWYSESTEDTRGALFLNGFNQTVSSISSPVRNSTTLGFAIGSDTVKNETLTLKARESNTSCCKLRGGASLVYDPLDPSYVQTISNRVHTTSGGLVVKGGRLIFGGDTTTLAQAGYIRAEGGAFEFHTAQEQALALLTNITVSSTGALVIDAPDAFRVDHVLDLVLETGATIDVPADTVLRVRNFIVDGTPMSGTFTHATCPVLPENLTVIAPDIAYKAGDEGAIGQLAGDCYVYVEQGATVTNTTAIGGSGRLVKAGLGTLVFTNANTYAGGTYVVSGTLRAVAGNAFGDGPVVIRGGNTVPCCVAFGPMLAAGTFPNAFSLENKSSNTYPAMSCNLHAQKLITFTGSITAPCDFYIVDADESFNGTRYLDFNCPVTVDGTLSHISGAGAYWLQPVKAKVFSANTTWMRTGEHYFYSPSNSFEKISFEYMKIKAKATNVLGGAVVHFCGGNSEAQRGFLGLGGYDQTAAYIVCSNVNKCINYWDYSAATLTLTGGTASAWCEAKLGAIQSAGQKVNLSVTVDAGHDDFVQTFNGRTNITYGRMRAKRGTLRFAGASTLPNVPEVIADGGTFDLATTQANALPSVTNVAVTSGGTFRFAATAATPFGEGTNTIVQIATGSTLEIPDGLVVPVQRFFRDGDGAPPGDYTGAGGPASARVSPLISGTGVLRVAKGPVGFQIIFR